MSIESQYLVLFENEQYGPYNLSQMRGVGLMTDTMVKILPDGEFRTAASYPELENYLMIVETQQLSNQSINLDTTQFYYRDNNGEMYGPLTLWELSLIDPKGDTELSIDEMQHWTLAENIPGLIDILRQISGEDEFHRINAHLQKINLDKDELEHVIEDQEKDLVNKQKEIQSKDQKLAEQEKELTKQLKELADKQKEIDYLKRNEEIHEWNIQKKQMELELMQSQPKVVDHHWVERPTFDLTSDYKDKYNSYEDQLGIVFSSFKKLLSKEEKFVKVFNSHDDEVEYHLNSYWHTTNKVCELIIQVEEIFKNATNVYNEDIQLLEGSLSKLQHESISQLNQKVKEAVEESKKQIRELENVNLSSKERFLNALKQELDEKKVEITRRLNCEKQRGILQISQIKAEITSLYHQLLNKLHHAEGILQQIEEDSSKFFDKSYDMASSSSGLWRKIEEKKQMPPTRLLLGNETLSINVDNKELRVKKRVFYDFLNAKHLLLRYNKESKNEAENFVTTLLGRLIASSRPGNIQLSVIDTEDMCGTSNILTRLNRQVYSLCVKSDDVRKIIDWMKDHIADIKVNLLQSPINSLLEYNQKKDNKEAYQVLVIKGFPFGFGGENLSVLNSILRNGINAGVNVILLIDEEELDSSEDAKKLMARISDDALHNCSSIDFANRTIDDNPLCNLDFLSDDALTQIVHYANKGFEVKEDEKVLLSDYLPTEKDWWNGHSDNHVEIPFGLTEDRQVQKLRIARTGGSNAAVVIGVSGSGKSVFLHTIICSSATHYSPEELQLYLIDFSGVEFNTYANHKLPHARVIAPEAEREFGLSVLRELVEEGKRRESIFRENDVNTIADLKEKNPNVKIPRLLVIIDEFQKLFEIENDKISQEANSMIFIIVKEFGKFGIHLILATQELLSSSVLPKDLIANRIVFKSKPNDFSTLISLPSNSRMPLLNAGECIYNKDSGSPYANSRVKSFFAKKNEIDDLLVRLDEYSQIHHQKADNLIVFRGNDLPSFSDRRIEEIHHYTSDIPDEVGVYFGESIAINETDVSAVIRKEAGNNILVIGGESNVAQSIAYYATLSTTTAHTDESASFYVFNYIRGAEDELAAMNDTILSLPFTVKMGVKMNDVIEFLTEIQAEIEARKNDETRALNHIYLSFYAFQLARMFDKGGRRGDDVSDCGKLLDFILRNGPTYGVFTILQVDNLESFSRIGTPISVFNYRIALQMSENDSNKVVGSSIANKIFVFNRPSSKFRAYFRDNNRNITIKFKPYK